MSTVDTADPSGQTEFDVFLCHNSADKTEVRAIATWLRALGVRPWLDEDALPGNTVQDLLEEQIASIKAAAVFVGAAGLGPWQRVEIGALLRQFAERRCRLIPVLLPGCATPPPLPLFLKDLLWVDFRRQTPDPMGQLHEAIVGARGGEERASKTSAPEADSRRATAVDVPVAAGSRRRVKITLFWGLVTVVIAGALVALAYSGYGFGGGEVDAGAAGSPDARSVFDPTDAGIDRAAPDLKEPLNMDLVPGL